MASVEQIDTGTVVSGYLSGSAGRDRVRMASVAKKRPARFDGDFAAWESGSLAGCDVSAEGPTRATSLCRWGGDVHIVGALVEGAADYVDDRVARPLPSSSVIVYPGRAPFDFGFTDAFRYVIVKVTAQDLGVSRGSLARLAGPRVIEPSPFSSAMAALLADSAAWARRPGTAGSGVDDEIRRLLWRMIRMSDERFFGVGVDRRHVVVLEWIEDHLSDPLLDPAGIARANHVSLRQLHRLFADLGITCRRYLVRRRLERIRAALVDTDLPLASIALRWGMTDVSYVSKAFAREFGLTPREVRRAPHLRPGGAAQRG